jgi:eukaryotic-like serine/threonine-protein kinase
VIGQVVGGQYKLVEELGSDSVFDLFRAEDSSASKQYFVRGISSNEPRSENFARQVHGLILKLKSVNHPGVEKLLNAHQESNGFYLVSQYSPGSVLDSRLKRLSSLSVPAAVAMAIDMCEGLRALHGAEIVHGDISPRTVLSTSNDGAKLLLPGMWRAYSQDQNLAVAVHSQMAPYLAPEVSSGDMPSAQSDIYSVGVLLWQVLVGRVPFYGDNPAAIAAKHASEPYPSLRMVAATVPMALDEIIKKCMDKNPLKRYASATSLLSDLTAVQDALRFGRKITWPIQGAVSTAEEHDVAPALNAVDGEPVDEVVEKKKKEKTKKSREKSDGIPVWLAWLFYFVTAMCMIFVGGWIFLNSQKPKTLEVPNLIGKQVEEARAELKKSGLKLREVRRDPSENYAEGEIIETDPAANAEIREGMRVEAIVSRGSKFVPVPDFRGLTVEAARKLAESLNLPISDTDIDLVRDRELDEGLIVSQIPEARKKVERFTKIRLKVSNGDRRVGSTRNADWHTNRVKMTIPADLGKEDVLVRIDVTDNQGTKTLFEELMVPGQEIDERVRWVGDELLIRIFFDGDLVKQLNEKPAKEEAE